MEPVDLPPGLPEAEDEELDTRRPRRLGTRQRWLGGGAALVLAAALTGLVVAHQGDGSDRASASASPSPSPSVLPSAVVNAPAIGVVYNDGPAVVAGSTIYTVQGGTLYRQDARDGKFAAANLDVTAQPDIEYALAVDAAQNRLWVVQLDAPGAAVLTFDSRTLAAVDRVHIDGRIAGITLLEHRLYVNSATGVLGISGPPEDLFSRTDIRGSADGIVADPSRDRLILLRLDAPRPRVEAASPAGPTPSAAAAAPFGKGDLVVVGGQIWAGGFGLNGAVLARLDPRTLAPAVHSPLERDLGPGAQIVSAGTHDLLVRSGGGGGELWCVDGRSGAVLQAWTGVPGTALLAPDGGPGGQPAVYLLPTEGSTPRTLDNAHCPG